MILKQILQESWKGVWDATVSYIVKDLVVLDNTLYICILANLNETPPDITYWEEFIIPTATTTVNSSQECTYDAEGNITTQTKNGLTRTFTWTNGNLTNISEWS